jgi:pilus assembly protein CpaC
LLAVALAPAHAQGRAQKNNAVLDVLHDSLVQLLVTVDKARTVGCDQEFSEVLVANPQIADVIALSNKQVYVLGKKAGSPASRWSAPTRRSSASSTSRSLMTSTPSRAGCANSSRTARSPSRR